MLLAFQVLGILISSGYVNSVTLEEFFGYPFGLEYGYEVFPRGHDSARGVSIPVNFPFFGSTFNLSQIDDSGYVSFLNLPQNSRAGTPYTPRDFPFTNAGPPDWSPVVAVFWADVSTSRNQSGLIYYKSVTAGTDEDLLNDINKYITAALPSMGGYQATWALIITWDRVGYVGDFDDNNLKLNTFQMVISTNGIRSAAIFLYADNGINWVTSDHSGGINGFGGTPAVAGYNAGDGVKFYKLPGSLTEDVQFLDSIPGNTGRIGEWVLRLDRSVPIDIGCQENAILSISPTAGNVLGGTPVVVSGPCLQDPTDIQCIFGDHSTAGEYLTNREAYLCTSPELQRIGRIPFTLVVRHGNGSVYRGYTSFQSVSFDRGHEVDILREDLALDSKSVQIKWNKNILLFESPETYTVDIYLFELNNDGSLSRPMNVAKRVTNTGMTVVRVPRVKHTQSLLVPVFLKVVPSEKTRRRKRQIDLDPKKSIGTWSGLVFSPRDGSSVQVMRKECDKWFRQQPDGGDLLKDTVPCPPTLDQARLPNSGLEEVNRQSIFQATKYADLSHAYYHPMTDICFQQRSVQRGPSSAGQECCYNSQGLVVGPPGGGSVNRQAPVDFMSSVKHITEDFIPFLYCCKAGQYSQCDKYYQKRPSDDGTRYQPPPPACIYGDPHVVTLDGHKYTFNGKGEFTMIQTEDSTFTVQGRMVEANDNEGSEVPATVFSALCAKAMDSDTVQVELVETGLRALVNGEEVNFGDSQQNDFANVTVADLGNQTLSAVFSSGPYIEVKVENGIISVVVVSLPVFMEGKTEGLMGNYNRNITDDLKPNNNADPLPLASSLRDIHYKFGITWIVNSSKDSLFTYSGNDSWSTFYDPDFVPLFEPVFNDSSLENTTYEICKDDLFCIFDIAATKRTEIGMSTLQGTEDLEMIVEMSKPVTCDPSCDHGACVSTNTCSCAAGYSGPTCSIPDIQPCEDNICLNGGSCTQGVATTSCDCPEGFDGTLCENGK
jgi:hypothetical protein